jgi:hypothetical protein
MLVIAPSLRAQTPLARFTEPTNTAATATSPVFRIITSHKIDTSSVRWNWKWIDSTHLQLPIIGVISYDFYASANDSAGSTDTLWASMAATGTGTVINDTTIEFDCGTLGNDRQFEAVLMGLRVISGSDTITIPDTVARMAFTTIDLPPRLVSISSIDSGGFVRCHDTLTAFFSKKLDSTNSALGPILSLVTPIISFDTVHDTVLESDSTIAMTAWLDHSDSSIEHILPTTAFDLGRNYQLNVKLSGLTGDTTQDGKWGFLVRKSYRLNITPAPTDGLACLPTIHFDPAINENYRLQYDSTISGGTVSYDTSVVFDSNYIGRIVNSGDTVIYTAPTHVGAALFKQWSGSGITTIDTSTNPVLTVTQSCENIHDLNIIALYKPAQVDTVCVSIAGTINWKQGVEVRPDTQDCHTTYLDTCITATSQNYTTERGKAVTLHAFSNSDTISFDHWESTTLPHINNTRTSVITIKTAGNGCASAVYVRTPPSAVFELCADIYKDDTLLPITSAIAHIMKPTPPPCSTTVASIALDAKLKIVDSTYGLKSYEIIAPGFDTVEDFGGKVIDLYASGGNGTFSPNPSISPFLSHPTATTNPATQVHFTLQQLQYTLTVYIQTDDGELPPPLSTGLTTGLEKNVIWCKLTGSPTPDVSQNTPRHTAGGPTYYSYTVLVDAGTTVSLNCGGNQGFSFDHWYNGSGYDYPSPNTNSSFSGIVMNQDRVVSAVFHAPFRLVSISYQYAALPGHIPILQLVTLPVEQWGGRQTNISAASIPWSEGTPATLTFHFSRAVSNYANLNGEFGYNEETPSFAGHQSGAASQAPGNANIYGHDVKFSLESYWETNKVWKGEDVGIEVGTGYYSPIKSSTGEMLTNPNNFECSTVNPDVSWVLYNTYVKEDHDVWYASIKGSWAYWLGQKNGIWSGSTPQTCAVNDDDDDNIGFSPAEWEYGIQYPEGWISPGYYYNKDDCTAPDTMIMVSCAQCSSSDVLSAGASFETSKGSGNGYLLVWDMIEADISSDLASTPADFANHYDNIATEILGPRYGNITSSTYNYLDCRANFPSARQMPYLWGASAFYKKTYWSFDDNWARIDMRVNFK